MCEYFYHIKIFTLKHHENLPTIYLTKLHAFFYKQHFYKQRHVEVGKKSSKC